MKPPRPFPWPALDHVPWRALMALRCTREALRNVILPRDMAAAASSLLGQSVTLLVNSVRVPRSFRPHHAGATCLMRDADGEVQVLVELEAALAACLVSHVLGRATPWIDGLSDAPPAVQAAAGAFCVSVARRCTPRHPLTLSAVGPAAREAIAHAPHDDVTLVDATLLVDDEAFSACATIIGRCRPTASVRPWDKAQVAKLGDLALTLRVVAAQSTGSRQAISALTVGDAWLPAQGWLSRGPGATIEGDVLLCAPLGTLGVRAKLECNGTIVVKEGFASAEVDVEPESREASGQVEDAVGSIAEVLSEAPVVVRVEIGAVTMSAREWAALEPGDVLTTSRRIAEPVVLRVAGAEVARGELVDVDGEVGVRILQVSSGGSR